MAKRLLLRIIRGKDKRKRDRGQQTQRREEGEGLDETLLDIIGILHAACLQSRALPTGCALARSSNPDPSWNAAQSEGEASSGW